MAANRSFSISIKLVGDNVSTVFSWDLSKDPYWFPDGTPAIWFVDQQGNKNTNPPMPVDVGAVNRDSGGRLISVSLSGLILTVTYALPPPSNTAPSVIVPLLF